MKQPILNAVWGEWCFSVAAFPILARNDSRYNCYAGSYVRVSTKNMLLEKGVAQKIKGRLPSLSINMDHGGKYSISEILSVEHKATLQWKSMLLPRPLNQWSFSVTYSNIFCQTTYRTRKKANNKNGQEVQLSPKFTVPTSAAIRSTIVCTELQFSFRRRK